MNAVLHTQQYTCGFLCSDSRKTFEIPVKELDTLKGYLRIVFSP